MSGIVTLVAFFGMLFLLVLVHELGHFLTARALHIPVEEFGIGYPPRALVLFERNGVKYTLNWLPIGGFVRFKGEGDQIYGVGSLSASAPWKKILVLVAGPLMNLLLAFIIFATLIGYRGVVDTSVDTVFPNTPAATAGFQSGDLIVSLAGVAIPRGETAAIAQIAVAHKGEPIEAVVQRNGQDVRLQVTPGPWVTNDGEQRETGFGFSYGERRLGVGQAIVAGWQQTVAVLGSFIVGLMQMFGGLLGVNEPPPGGVTGVVGIARGTGEIIQREGLPGFWLWTAFISLNLFLVNLLPIPALDGSHIVFSLVEIARRGKKIPPEKEAMVHAFGFVMVLGLMVLITVSDVANWIRGAPVLGGG